MENSREFRLIRAHVNSIVLDPAKLVPTYLSWRWISRQRLPCKCECKWCSCEHAYACENCDIIAYESDKDIYSRYCSSIVPLDLDVRRMKALGQHFSKEIRIQCAVYDGCFICGIPIASRFYKHKNRPMYICEFCKGQSDKLFCIELLMLLPHILSYLSAKCIDVLQYMTLFILQVCWGPSIHGPILS